MATQLHDASETKSAIDDAIDKTRELYDTAKEWLPENYPTALMVGGAAVGAGVVGYLIGKASQSPEFRAELPKPPQSAGPLTEKLADFDVNRALKFVKLWMLYRAAL